MLTKRHFRQAGEIPKFITVLLGIRLIISDPIFIMAILSWNGIIK